MVTRRLLQRVSFLVDHEGGYIEWHRRSESGSYMVLPSHIVYCMAQELVFVPRTP